MIYLIDYENVHEKGFDYLPDLRPYDSVYVFYSASHNKIELEYVEKLCSSGAKLVFKKIQEGKQAVDLCIAFHIGHLLNSINYEEHFVIVSNDKGFASVRAFVDSVSPRTTIDFIDSIDTSKKVKSSDLAVVNKTELNNNSAERSLLFKTPDAYYFNLLSNENQAKTLELIDAQDTNTEVSISNEEQVHKKDKFAKNEKTIFNNYILQEISRLNFGSSKTGQATSFIVKHITDKNAKSKIYTEMLKIFGNKKGLQVYRLLKELNIFDN